MDFYWDYLQYRKAQQIRQMRRSYSTQGWTVLIYLGIMYAAIYAVLFVDMVLSRGVVDEQQAMDHSGWGYLIAIGIGVCILLLWKHPEFTFGTIWKRNRPMEAGSFFQILSLFMSAQTVFILLAVLAEQLLNDMGMTLQTESSLDYDGLSMFLYVGIGAPISEELLFRGLILRSMEPYGKKFAIFASALLFGLFHANISQVPYAFCVGLVLGYVTVEHNIGWAMALHMFNNLIISDVTGRLDQLLPYGLANMVVNLLILGMTVAAVVILIVQRKKIRQYLQENQNVPGCGKAFWTAPGILVLVCYLVGSTILSLIQDLVPL